MLCVIGFAGVMANATVYLDGVPIVSHISGYTPFRVDVTSYFHDTTTPHTLLVRADGTKVATYGAEHDYWWYFLLPTAPSALSVLMSSSLPHVDAGRSLNRK